MAKALHFQGGIEDMADEAGHKLDMLIKNLDKLNEVVQKLQIDMAVTSQKFRDHADLVLDKFDSVFGDMSSMREKVEVMRENELKKEGFMQGVKLIFLKHPLVIPCIFAGLFFLLQSDFVRQHFLK